jgi:hypothetical protein
MPTTFFGRYAAAWALLLVVLLSTAACVTRGSTDDGEVEDRATAWGTTSEVTNAEPSGCPGSEARPAVEADARAALEADARAYAKDEDIPLNEARRRLRLGDCFVDDVADLEQVLRKEEADTFAGSWGN